MRQNTRKLVGTLGTLALIVVYSGLATAIYLQFLQGAPPLGLLAYFVVAGLGWGIPTAVIIRWMARPDSV